VAFVEIVAISYVYGLNNFCNDIEFMLNQKVNPYFKICWKFITPGFLLAIIIYWAATYKSPIPVSKGYTQLSQVCAWLLSGLTLLLIPLLGAHSVWKAKGVGFLEKFRNSLQSKADWGPADPKLRAEWVEWKKYR
jgi:solute carrier family 6 amino acid transporter-like protein 5/7/9/14